MFLKNMWEKGRAWCIFFNFQGLCFVIACCILLKNITFQIKRDSFLYYGYFQIRKHSFHHILRRTVLKNKRIFCLCKRLPYYIVVEKLVTPGVFFHNFILKAGWLGFLFPISKEFGLTLWIRHSSSDSIF